MEQKDREIIGGYVGREAFDPDQFNRREEGACEVFYDKPGEPGKIQAETVSLVDLVIVSLEPLRAFADVLCGEDFPPCGQALKALVEKARNEIKQAVDTVDRAFGGTLEVERVELAPGRVALNEGDCIAARLMRITPDPQAEKGG